jgi:hypothetical protein
MSIELPSMRRSSIDSLRDSVGEAGHGDGVFKVYDQDVRVSKGHGRPVGSALAHPAASGYADLSSRARLGEDLFWFQRSVRARLRPDTIKGKLAYSGAASATLGLSIAAAVKGAALGAAVGSVIPGIGTGVGAVLGLVIAGIASAGGIGYLVGRLTEPSGARGDGRAERDRTDQRMAEAARFLGLGDRPRDLVRQARFDTRRGGAREFEGRFTAAQTLLAAAGFGMSLKDLGYEGLGFKRQEIDTQLAGLIEWSFRDNPPKTPTDVTERLRDALLEFKEGLDEYRPQLEERFLREQGEESERFSSIGSASDLEAEADIAEPQAEIADRRGSS